MEQGEASRILCEMCGKEMESRVGYTVQSQDGIKFLQLCAPCRRKFAIRKAKITPAPTNLAHDLTGKNIRCWFVVAYAGQRDGVHYWKCMSRASLAEKVVAEQEILDRKLNEVSEVPNHWTEAEKNRTGWIYGEWTVVGPASTPLKCRKNPGPFWKCRCICGKEKDISQSDLKSIASFSKFTIVRQNEKNISKRDLKSAGPTALCCGCRSEAEVREELWWRKKLASEGWKNECDAVYRHTRERQFDKKWTREMERSLRRFQPACVICGSFNHLTIHHVRPVSRGHGLEPGNTVRLCRACNSFIGMKEPGELPPGMAQKLDTAAVQFKEHWESGCTTPATPTVTPAEKTPKALDPTFIRLLRSLERGEETAIPALADWLEEYGDPRASAIREVAKMETLVRETQWTQKELRLIGGGTWEADDSETQKGAKEVLLWIEFQLNGKRYGPMVSVTRNSGDTEEWLAQRTREELRYRQSNDVWLRLGLTQTESDTLKRYLGIDNPMGVAATIEEISQREGKQVQTIRNRIDSALHHLTFRVRRVPGRPGGVWRAAVGDAPPDLSKPAWRR